MKPATRITMIGRDGPEYKLCDECNDLVRKRGLRTFFAGHVEDEEEECERCIDPQDFDEAVSDE